MTKLRKSGKVSQQKAMGIFPKTAEKAVLSPLFSEQ